jgi:hypothetical protein
LHCKRRTPGAQLGPKRMARDVSTHSISLRAKLFARHDNGNALTRTKEFHFQSVWKF